MMQCATGLSPTYKEKGWPCGDGRALFSPEKSHAGALLEFDIIHSPEDRPRDWTTTSALRVRAYVWDQSGQGYVSETEAWYDVIWESFFEDEVTYTHDPEKFIRNDKPQGLNPTRTLQTLEDHILIVEYCGSKRAMWVNCMDEYKTRPSPGEESMVGKPVAVLVRQKKLDLELRFWMVSDERGHLRDLYAVASDIRAVWWDYPRCSDHLDGPLVARLHTSTIFGRGWPERFSPVDRPCPDSLYQSVTVKNAT